MITSAQVVETSVNVTSNSPSQDYTHLDDHNLPNYSTYTVISLIKKTILFKNVAHKFAFKTFDIKYIQVPSDPLLGS